MKQLVNKTTNHIVRIELIDPHQNRIIYSEYECIVYDDDSNIKKEYKLGSPKAYYFTQINLKNYLDLSTNYTDLCLSQLIIELYTDYIIEDSLQNWLFTEKPNRVIIQSKEHNIELLNNIDYKTLVDELFIRHVGFIKVSDNIIIMYVNGLNPIELITVQFFINKWIFTENKL